MDNHNTFNPSVDPNEPTPPSVDQPSAEHGYTSNEQGYGVDEYGKDKDKSDLTVDPDYYNRQAHMGADALYAAAEDEIAAENAAFENAWNEEAAEKERQDSERVRRALVELRTNVDSAIDGVIALIGKDAAQAPGSGPNPPANSANMPTVDNTTAKGATTTISNANARNDVNANIQTPEDAGDKKS